MLPIPCRSWPVIRPTALFSLRIDETAFEQIMPIVHRHNVLDANVVPQWLQLSRNRYYSIILIRIGDAKIRTRVPR
jgi:hypothetical protein